MKKWLIVCIGMCILAGGTALFKRGYFQEELTFPLVETYFIEGEFQKAKNLLNKLPRQSLLQAYIENYQGNFTHSINELQRYQQSTKSQEKHFLEIFNQILLYQNPTLPIDLLKYKEGILLQSEICFRKREFALTHETFRQSHFLPSYPSKLFSKVFSKHFPPSHWEILRARCLIALGNYASAREQLENLPYSQQTSEGLFFIGLSYIKEAEEKNISAALPYCKLAYSYFERVPYHLELHQQECENFLALWKKWGEECIQQRKFSELNGFSVLLENYKTQKAILQLTEQLLLKVKQDIERISLDEIQAYSLQLSQALESEGMRQQFEHLVKQAVQEQIKTQDIEHLTRFWRFGKWFTPDHVKKSESIMGLVESKIQEQLFEKKQTLRETAPLIDFWNFLKLTSNKNEIFVFQLLDHLSEMWSKQEHFDQKQALALMKTLPSFTSSQNQQLLEKKIKEQLKKNLKSNHTLPFKEACAYYNIESSSLEQTHSQDTENYSTLITQGKLPEAEEVLLKLIRESAHISQKNTFIPALAQVYVKWGRWDEALTCYQNYQQIQNQPDHPSKELINLYISLDRWDHVVYHLETIQKHRSLHMDEKALKTCAFWNTGKHESSRKLLLQIVNDQNFWSNTSWFSQIQIMRLAYDVNLYSLVEKFETPMTTIPDALPSLLKLYQHIGSSKKINTLLKQHTPSLLATPSGLIALAETKLYQGEREKALHLAYQAHKLSPYSFDIQSFIHKNDKNLIRRQQLQKRMDSMSNKIKQTLWWKLLTAKNQLTMAVETHSEKCTEHYRTHLQQITKQLFQVIDKEHYNLEPYILQAQVYYLLGEDQAAIQGLQHVIKHTPSKIEPYILLSKIYQEQNTPILAKQTLQTALEYDPENTEVTLALVDLLMNTHQQTHAQKILEKKIKEGNTPYLYSLSLAQIYLENNKLVLAKHTLANALMEFPDHSELLRLLVKCMEQGGEDPGEIEAVQKRVTNI